MKMKEFMGERKEKKMRLVLEEGGKEKWLLQQYYFLGNTKISEYKKGTEVENWTEA